VLLMMLSKVDVEGQFCTNMLKKEYEQLLVLRWINKRPDDRRKMLSLGTLTIASKASRHNSSNK
jgi:hypothetical protein